MATDVSQLIAERVARLEPLQRQMNEGYWEVATTGNAEAAERFAACEKAVRTVLSDPSAYRQLRELEQAPVQDPLQARQVRLLRLAHASEQHSAETIADLQAALAVEDLTELVHDGQGQLDVQRKTCCLAFTLPTPKVCRGCCIK